MHTRWITAIAALLLTACGGGPYADVSGTIGAESFTAQTYYWGGPSLVFVNDAYDCMDLSWVRRGTTYVSGQEAPVDQDIRALLITYDESDVVAGNYNLEGDAPVDARLLDVSDGALTVFTATTGNLIIDEITNKDRAIGSFVLGFDEGDATGDFEIDWCNNLKAR